MKIPRWDDDYTPGHVAEGLDFARHHRIGHATGTTVNDVCLTLVAGAVARYPPSDG